MLQVIPLTHLHEDARSANCMSEERFTKLIENIRYTGQMQPLTVRPHPKKKGQFIIIDGHYRKQALEHLNRLEAPCDIWDIDTKAAGLLLATLNRLKGEDHPKKRAELLDELLKEFEKDRLCQLIPESIPELENLLSLLEQDEEALSQMLKEQLEAEASELPMILNFVLSKSDAEMVQSVLLKLEEDTNLALVKLCKETNHV
jgi:ParB family chromosome partitioning protein